MDPDTVYTSDKEQVTEWDTPQLNRGRVSDRFDGQLSGQDSIDDRLDEALERVVHGAAVSVPGVVLQKILALLLTTILTNGFSASSYGLYALANRIQKYLASLVSGFRNGLHRFLPATSDTEQDVLATFASLLLLSAAIIFGIALYFSTPVIVKWSNYGPQFTVYLRLFAVGLPATVWLYTVIAIYRGFEEVGGLNLILRVGLPGAHLIVGVIGAYVFQDLVLVISGVVVSTALMGIIGAVWISAKHELKPRFRGVSASNIRRRYIGFTMPLFFSGFASATQRLGYYPMIIFFLSDIAGGVFAIGILLGSFVRLPLIGINQFIPPVAASLHEENHRDALRRLYHVTSRLVLIAVLALAVPLIIYRTEVMHLFGTTFGKYAILLPGFILGQVVACATGSVGILLMMTDHQRAVLVINVVLTVFLMATAIPLTIIYGLPGLVGSYLLMLVMNNMLQITILYYFEGLQPFTRLYMTPLLGAVPLVLVTMSGKVIFSGAISPIIGTLFGLTAYAITLHTLGFTKVERRLTRLLFVRYKKAIRDFSNSRSVIRTESILNLITKSMGILMVFGGAVKALLGSTVPNHLFGIFVMMGGFFIVIGMIHNGKMESYRLGRVVASLLFILVVLGATVAIIARYLEGMYPL